MAYTISKDSSGYTIAAIATGATDFRDTNSKYVIQKAIDKLSATYILIKSGTYAIGQNLYQQGVDHRRGERDLLDSGSTCSGAVIRVCNDYWTLDNRYMSARPNGITIGNMQIDGNRASGGKQMKGSAL